MPEHFSGLLWRRLQPPVKLGCPFRIFTVQILIHLSAVGIRGPCMKGQLEKIVEWFQVILQQAHNALLLRGRLILRGYLLLIGIERHQIILKNGRRIGFLRFRIQP